jgi:hypothetical protein
VHDFLLHRLWPEVYRAAGGFIDRRRKIGPPRCSPVRALRAHGPAE